MAATRAVLAMAIIAGAAGGLLGWQAPGLWSPVKSEPQALARYVGWLAVFPHVAVAVCLSYALTRLGAGGGKLGPNARLNLFHDGNALVGAGLAIAVHGSGAAWPLIFAVAGRLLVTATQALQLRRGVAAAAVWAYATAALLLNSSCEGAGAAHWCSLFLPARWMPLAAALDRFGGVAPPHFTVGVAFRFTLMRYVSWALDTLDGRIVQATSPGAVERTYGAHSAHANPSAQRQAGEAAPESPRIGALGAVGVTSPEALFTQPESPMKGRLHATSTAGLASASWAAFFSYLFFAPCYLVGPVLSAALFYQQAAATAAGMSPTRRTLSGAQWWRAAARLAGFCAFAEALRRSTLLADGGMQALLGAQPWHAWAAGYALLTALFAQSFVPWTCARLCAGPLGIAPADEAPCGFLRSSLTPSTFWRNFHVSWGRWLKQYVYAPLGATPTALVLTMAASAMLHGGSAAWLTWGGIQAGALMAERWLSRRGAASLGPLGRLHPHLRASLAQCTAMTTLLVQLPVSASLPTFLTCFHAVNIPFCTLNAARLARCADDGKGGKAGAASSAVGAAPDRVAAKLATAAKLAVD